MSSFPISITWSVGTPPTGSFNTLAQAAKNLDSALLASGQKFDQFGQTITQLEAPLQGAGQGMGELASNMQGLDSSLGNSGAAMGELATSTEQMANAVEGTGSSIQELGSSLEDAGSSAQDASGNITDAGSAMDEAGSSAQDATGGITDMGTALDDTSTSATDATTGITEFGTGVEDSIASVDTMNTSLTDMGGIFAEAGTATEEYTGALAGMNDENQAVSGGLEENNTLMGNLATTTDNTRQSQVGFNTSLAQVGTGMVGLVGAGIQLFNAYDNLGDSAMRVEAANVRLERSQAMLESKMLTLSKTTNQMNSDSSLMISGLGEWNAAQQALNDLLSQGVTSGTEWDAALQRARTAQDGLSSSTAKGNEIITRTGIVLDQTAGAAKRVEVNAWQVTNAQEAQAQAWAQLVTAVVTVTGVTGNLSTTMGGIQLVVNSGRAAIDKLRSGLGTLSTAMASNMTFMKGLGVTAIAVAAALLILNEATKAMNIENQNTVIKFNDAKKAIDGVNETMRGWISQIPGIGPLIAGVNKSLEDQINSLTGVTQATDDNTASQGPLQNALSSLMTPLDQVTQSMFQNAMAAEQAGLGTAVAAGGFQDLGKGAGVVVNGVKMAEDQITRFSDGTILLNGVLKETKTQTEDTAATIEELGTTTLTYGDALSKVQEKLAQQSIEADNTHQMNLALLQQWGVEFPQALRGDMEAIQALVNIHADENAAVSESVVKAKQYIIEHEGIQAIIGKTDQQILAYAKSLETKVKAQEKDAKAMEDTGVAALTYGDAIALVAKEQKDANTEAENTHQKNLALLEQYGIDFPQALRGNISAIQGIVNAHQDEISSIDETVVAASEYIEEHGGMQQAAGMTDEQIIALAESLGFETEETKKAGEEMKAFEEKIKQMAAAQNDAAQESIGIKDAIKAEGEELKKATEKRRQAAIELGIYNDMVQLAIPLQDDLIKLVQDEKSEREGQITELQKLARERGLENSQLTDNIDTLNKYIQTNELLPPTMQEIETEYTKLLVQKQEEEKKTDLSTKALARYVEEQYNVADASHASVGVLQAFVDMMEGVANASDAAELRLAEFVKSTIVANEEEEAYHDVLQKVVGAMTGDFVPAVGQSTEAMEQLIAIMLGSEEAFGQVVDALEGWKEKIIGTLADAAKEGKDEFMDAIDDLQDQLDIEFDEPLVQKIQFEADMKNATDNINTALGVLATALTPIQIGDKLVFDTGPIRSAIDVVQQALNNVPLGAEAKFLPLKTALSELGEVDFTNMQEVAPALARVVAEANAAGTPMNNLVGIMGQLPSVAEMSASELQSMEQAFASVGLTFDTASGKITDAAGNVIGTVGQMGPATQTAADETSSALLGIGQSGDAARDAWARDMMIMFLAVDQFGKHAQVMAITVSGAYSNMSTNVTASLNTFASGFIIIISAVDGFAKKSQTMATTVSGSFSNMATNTIASMNRMASGIIIILTSFQRIPQEAQKMNTTVSSAFQQMASKAASFGSSFSSMASKVTSDANRAASAVKSLASAINSLKSKTVTITTVYRRVIQTVYAAKGAAFVTSNPTNIAGARVSEFGQRELVTVTPLEGPGRTAIKGVTNILAGESEKKGRRAMDEERERRPSPRAKEVTMMRELPIVIQIDGREIARVVNRRLFEGSDALA